MDLSNARPINDPNRRSLADELYRLVRERVRSGEMTAGERLPTEKELIQAFGVSRTTVREALARLAAEGLVTARQGLGVFVTDDAHFEAFNISSEELKTLDDVRKLLELRLGIETEMVALAAARRSDDDVAVLRAQLVAIREAQSEDEAAKADTALHQAIARAAHNQYFERILAFVGSRLVPPRSLVARSWTTQEAKAYADQLDSEHTAIVDAIALGDPEAARTALRAHLADSLNRHLRAMETS